MLIPLLSTKSSTLNSAVVDICAVPACMEGSSQSFKDGKAQSRLLTALIGHLNVLLEYFDFSNFHLQS